MFRLLKLLLSMYSRWLSYVGRTDRLFVMSTLAKCIMPEYRFKWPELDWWNNSSFNAMMGQFNELEGFNLDRRWTLDQLMRLVVCVPGDTAECGVYKGLGSYIICHRNRQATSLPRTHHVFDSFAGLSQPQSQVDGSHWHAGDMFAEEQEFRKHLKPFEESLQIHPGWIPSRFSDIAEKAFCFVHIDVDLYEPTRDSIAFFYERMSPGGIVVCDDYGFGTCPGATKAIDEFMQDKPEKMISLCSGGGFFIRGTNTSDAA